MTRPAEIWMQLEALAASYERIHGHRPNRMDIGAGVAAELEPDHGEHPLHTAWESPVPGIWRPTRPIVVFELFWRRWAREWRCKHRDGGHWWHPADPMIAWFCCQCGKDRDGWPEDGT